jgi:hypothetical protein
MQFNQFYNHVREWDFFLKWTIVQFLSHVHDGTQEAETS